MFAVRLSRPIVALLVVALTAGLRPPLAAADPPSLAAVPADAVGFVHVPVPAVWKHDMLKGLREAVAAAGPKALAAFEKQVYPSPTALDRVTVIALSAAGADGPQVVAVVGFSEAIDPPKVRKLYLPNPEEMTAGGKTYHADKDRDLGLYFPDDRHLVVGPAAAVGKFLAAPAGPGPLAGAVKRAAGGTAVVAAVNVNALKIPPGALNDLPADVRPLFAAERVVLSIDMAAPDVVIAVRAGYAGEPAAKDAEAAVKAAAALAKKMLAQPRKELEEKLFGQADRGPRPLGEAAELAAALVGIGGMNRIDALLDDPPLKREGAELAASVTVPKEATAVGGAYTAVALGFLLPAVQKVRFAAGRSVGQNNLKQIGLAMHNHHDVFGKFPAAAIQKDGKPLLSWRVAILPFIEEDNLYKQFKLDEPWDSEHNKKLIPKMPKVYVSPRVAAGEGKTVYKVFVGPKAMFQTDKGGTFAQITDGLSNTIMAVEGGEPVTWTKPDDIPFDPDQAFPKLELPGGIKQINVLFGDGSVRSLDLNRVKEATLKLLVQPNDGQVIDQKEIDR